MIHAIDANVDAVEVTDASEEVLHEEVDRAASYYEVRGADCKYDTLQMYFNEMRTFNLLTHAEEAELGKRILAGDRSACNTLVERNLRLVLWVIRRWFPWSPIPFGDLVQEGNVGLMTAAGKFDFTKGCKFSTYATWWIRQAVGRAIQDMGHVVRVPVYKQEVITKVIRAVRSLEAKTGKAPTVEQVAAESGLPLDDVREALALRRSMDVSSLDDEVYNANEGSSVTHCDQLPDAASITQEVYIEALQELTTLREQFAEVIEAVTSKLCLSERDVRIFKSFYGVEDSVRKTLEEAGAEFGVTRERIRQIIAKIWQKLEDVGIGGDHDGFREAMVSIDELEKIVFSAR